ncbi:MFS transporter [Acidimangrovimonas sediminis]|uniref:MFS transporter n=1 Tax=Acidimangrovimonas sediminis TaxID=2056283 RepID=UPI0018EDC545|nr:MFS transporter [Acidimangrovimonas sediminis]
MRDTQDKAAPTAGDRTTTSRADQIVHEDGLPSPRRQFAWLAIMLGLTLAVLDGTIANVALPTIAEQFNAQPSISIWIVNGYQLAIVMTLMPLASLGEIYGYRRIYLGGITLFTIASVGCVMADSLTTLTIARVLQGLGAAGLMSVNTAVLRYTVPKAKFGTALGYNALIVAVAATAGPAFAGAMLSHLSWPWLFAINIPLGLLTIAVGLRSLPHSDRARHPFDWQSAVLSALSLGLAISIVDLSGHDLAWYEIVPLAALCALGFWLLVRRNKRSSHPLLPLDLLSIPIFSLSLAASVSAFTTQLVAFVALPFVFQTDMGFAPAMVGALMMPWPLATGIVAPIAGRLSDNRSPAMIGGAGMAMLAAGMIALALLPAHPSIWDIAWRMALAGAGFGLFQAPNNRTIVGTAPRHRSGAASGMLGTARLTGQSTGAALVALMLGWFGIAGANHALYLGAGAAALAGLLSLSRRSLWRAPS